MLKKDVRPSLCSCYYEVYIPRKYCPVSKVPSYGLFRRTKTPGQEEVVSFIQWLDELRPVPGTQRLWGQRGTWVRGSRSCNQGSGAHGGGEGHPRSISGGWRREQGTGGANFARILVHLWKNGGGGGPYDDSLNWVKFEDKELLISNKVEYLSVWNE